MVVLPLSVSFGSCFISFYTILSLVVSSSLTVCVFVVAFCLFEVVLFVFISHFMFCCGHFAHLPGCYVYL